MTTIDETPGRHGAFTRQDLARQVGEYAVRVGLRDGVYQQPWRGVVLLREMALDPKARASAALLAVGPDAVLSGLTAAGLFGLTAAQDTVAVHLTVPDRLHRRNRPGLVLHTDACPNARDVVTRFAMPIFALDRVVADVLCSAPPRLALAVADQALAAVATGRREAFRARVDDRLAARARGRGTRTAEALLHLACEKAESPGESWLRLLVAEAGWPTPEPQFEVRDVTGKVIYRLDLAWPRLRIALEYDGFDAHEGKETADAERDRRLRGRGWLVIRARAEDLAEPGRLLRELETAFRQRGARGSVSPTRSAC